MGLRDAMEEGLGHTWRWGQIENTAGKGGHADCQASQQENTSGHSGKLRQKTWDGWRKVCRVGAAHTLCPEQSCLGVVGAQALAPGGKDHIVSICFLQDSAMPAS